MGRGAAPTRLAPGVTTRAVLASALVLAGCPSAAKTSAAHTETISRVPAPPGATWRDRCARLIESTRDDLAREIPALARGTVTVTRDPETVVRLDVKLAANAYYEVIVGEESPNRDFDTDVTEGAWSDVRERLRPIPAPIVALRRRHAARDGAIDADRVPADAAHSFATRFEPVVEECLFLAERVVSRDFYFVSTIVAPAALGASPAITEINVADDPHATITMRVEEADKDAPFTNGATVRFAVADASRFPAAGERKSYWLRVDTENGVKSYALARTISMIDDNDKCPERPRADGGVDAGADDDGCP